MTSTPLTFQDETRAGRSAKSFRSWRPWVYAFLGAAGVAAAAFVGGLYVGRWVVRNHVRDQIEEALHEWRTGKANSADLEVTGEWVPKNTALVRLETTDIDLPNEGEDGWGGGIQPMEGGAILYATRTGEFKVIGTDGIVKPLPFKVDMNLDALKRHPVFKLKNFNFQWFRVTDINLKSMGAGRYELLVGHHYFEPKGQCVELRLSRAVIQTAGTDVSLAEPFRTVLTTKPCITFNLPGYADVFEGHFSGGRIVRMGADQVLFSTGDQGWVGLRGYPALAQDDNSTLGKVLLVNLSTNEVSIFAKGFRNPQGLTIDSMGRIWLTDQGPMGGDELNLIVKGQNYGWPNSTYGTDYGPRPWPMSVEQGRYDTGAKPDFVWNPSIATSNLIEVKGDEFPLWKGDLLVAALGGQAIHRLRLDGTRVIYDEPIKFEFNRFRDIVELPNGQIALLIDSGSIKLLRNADAHSKAPYLDSRSKQPRTIDMSVEERAVAVAGRYANPENAADVVQEASTQLPADAARGELVFKRNCATCHSMDSATSLVGPSLKGVIGRQVGSAGFAYSSGLMAKREVWTSESIVHFAVNPGRDYPGTIMPPVALAPDARRDLESYLEARGR
jgi:cytochrome c2